MSRTGRMLGILLLAAAIGSLPAPREAGAGEEIMIEVGGLEPPLLSTTIERRVRFVNRTGGLVHVEFGQTPAGHQVFQVPGQIWATFHVPGRHPYVVHLGEGSRMRALEGAVQVSDDESRRSSPPVCNGTTVGSDKAEVCIER